MASTAARLLTVTVLPALRVTSPLTVDAVLARLKIRLPSLTRFPLMVCPSALAKYNPAPVATFTLTS